MDEWHICDGITCNPCPQLYKCDTTSHACVECSKQESGCSQGKCGDPNPCGQQPTTKYSCDPHKGCQEQSDGPLTEDECKTVCKQYYSCNKEECLDQYSSTKPDKGILGKCGDPNPCGQQPTPAPTPAKDKKNWIGWLAGGIGLLILIIVIILVVVYYSTKGKKSNKSRQKSR